MNEINYNNILLTEEQKNIRKSIYDSVIENELKKKEKNQLKDFNFMSASLSRFMPQIPIEEHWNTYLKIITTMRMREFDISDLYSVTDQIVGKYEFGMNLEKPKIFITCHLGFCKASMGLLILNGVTKIVLVVDDATYKNQADKILSMTERVKELFQIDFSFKIINVEKPNTALEMIELLKKGYSLFAYLDGNSGYKGVYNKEKSIEIPFLRSIICSRTGLSKLAYFTSTPIVPFIAYYDDNKVPIMKLFPEIQRENSTSIEDFTKNTTLTLYNTFETYIEKYVDQWESWFYIHKYLPKEILSSSNVQLSTNDISQTDFEINKYSVFKIDEDHYLFNRTSFSVFPIGKETYQIFKRFQDA